MTSPKKEPEVAGKTDDSAEPFVFLADYGLHLDDLGVAFALDLDAGEKVSNTGQQGGPGSRTFRYETADSKVIDALRKLASGNNEYGIREGK